MITVIGKQLAKFNQVPQCSEYVDEGAVATDNVDSDEFITSQVKRELRMLEEWRGRYQICKEEEEEEEEEEEVTHMCWVHENITDSDNGASSGHTNAGRDDDYLRCGGLIGKYGRDRDSNC